MEESLSVVILFVSLIFLLDIVMLHILLITSILVNIKKLTQ